MASQRGIRFNWVLIVILVLAVLLFLFLITTGKKDKIEHFKPKEFKENKEKAEIRNNQLKVILRGKRPLKKQLDRKSFIIHLSVRFLFVLLYLSPIFILYFFGFLTSLASITSIFAFFSIVLTLIYYVVKGKKFNLQEFDESIGLKIRNWVYGKYIDIDESISSNEEELKQS